MKTSSTKRLLFIRLLVLAIVISIFPILPIAASASEDRPPVAPAMQLKLLVVDFDPVLPTRGGIRFTEYYKQAGKTTRQVTDDIASRLQEASHGILNYNATYETINEFPMQKDGSRVEPNTFPDIWDETLESGIAWWDIPMFYPGAVSGGFDYEYYINKWNLVERRNNNEFDEIWMFAEFCGANETAMVGKGAYWINGQAFEADCEPFRINWIQKSRDDTPLENLTHSAESIMSRVYKTGEWYYNPPKAIDEMSNWEKFVQYDKVNPGNAAAGNVHYAPNSDGDYDWGNTNRVYSTWRDWRDNFPNLTGEKEIVDNSVWGGGNNLDHKTWWFSCFPHVTGRDERGYSNNWWEYFQKFVYTVKIELFIDEEPINSFFTIEQGRTYNFKVFATLTDGSRLDVTNDCTIEIDKNPNGSHYYTIDTNTGTLTALASAVDARLYAWRDGVSTTGQSSGVRDFSYDNQTWSVQTGSWRAIDGKMITTGGLSVALDRGTVYSDFTYTLTLRLRRQNDGSVSGDAGIMWWTRGNYDDFDYYLGLYPNSGSVILYGPGLGITKDYGILPDVDYDIALIAQNRNIKIYINNDLLFDVSVGADAHVEGMLGVRTYYCPAEVSNIKIASTAISEQRPSSWAEASVSAAIAANLVPQNLQSGYAQAITRAEFAALATALYENIKGEITGRSTFTDTSDVNVQKAAFIGVVLGVGDNRFDPDSTLSREQAAVMLLRLADAIGRPFPALAPSFSDNGYISSWAFEGVGAAQAAGIMNGVGDNRFDPSGSYTREQSIVTIMRAFDFLK